MKKNILISLLLSLCIFKTSYATNDYEHHLVINQGNATSQAILYKVNLQLKNAQPELVNHSFITNASSVALLGLAANIKNEQDAIIMMQSCISQLKQQYKQVNDADINLASVIVGISKYNLHADSLSEHNNKRKIENFNTALVSTLNENKFYCNDNTIKYMQDTTLMAKTAITIANNNTSYPTGLNTDNTKLDEEYSINNNTITGPNPDEDEVCLVEDQGSWHPQQLEQPIKNIWCFFITDTAMLYLAESKHKNIENTIDINKELVLSGNSYKYLGKQTAKLFSACINTESSVGKMQTQKILSAGDLGKEILSTQNQSLAYWLKPSLSTSKKTNTRGLALYKYLLNNIYFFGMLYEYYPRSTLCGGHFLGLSNKEDNSSSEDYIKSPEKPGWGIRSDGELVSLHCPKGCKRYGKTMQEIEDSIPQQIPIYAEDNLTTQQKQDIGIIDESDKGGWTDNSCRECFSINDSLIEDNCQKLKQLMQEDDDGNIIIGKDDLVVFLGDGLFINAILKNYYVSLGIKYLLDQPNKNEYKEVIDKLVIANKKLFIDNIMQTAYKIIKSTN